MNLLSLIPINIKGESFRFLPIESGEAKFYMLECPLTEGQWRSIMGSLPSEYRAYGADCPFVIDKVIAKQDIQAFIQAFINEMPSSIIVKLQEQSRKKFNLSLQSFEEWKLAADEHYRIAKYGEKADILSAAQCDRATLPEVKTKPPQSNGLYDVIGTVGELCEGGEVVGGSYASSFHELKNISQYHTAEHMGIRLVIRMI